MLHLSPALFAVPLADDMIGSVYQLRLPLIALVLAFLFTSAGCGSFFPGKNDIASIQVAPQNATVAPGVQQQYTATATYGDNSTGDVTSTSTWSTNPTSVATISSSGLLTGVALGTATVKAQNGSATSTTGVSIQTKQVTSVSIQPLTQTLSASGANGLPTMVQFTATATYQDGSMGTVTNTSTWTSIPSTVATISNSSGSTGLATAVAVGTATVTATNTGVTSNAATITVVQ